MLELEALEFEPPAAGHCCALCNPAAFADYERPCVAVRRSGGNRTYVCASCVVLLGRALRRREVQTNAKDLAWWGALVSAAEKALQRAKR